MLIKMNTDEYNLQKVWDLIKNPNLRIHGVNSYKLKREQKYKLKRHRKNIQWNYNRKFSKPM
jgi:hypothetical protein